MTAPTRTGHILIINGANEDIHTNAHPFCNDRFCRCHDDGEYVTTHCLQPYIDGLVTKEEAERIYWGRQIS